MISIYALYKKRQFLYRYDFIVITTEHKCVVKRRIFITDASRWLCLLISSTVYVAFIVIAIELVTLEFCVQNLESYVMSFNNAYIRYDIDNHNVTIETQDISL